MSNTFTKTSLRGFTLIELLVVIAIIGLLSTAIMGPVQTGLKKGRDTRKISDLTQVQGALLQYAGDNSGTYPIVLTALSPTYMATATNMLNANDGPLKLSASRDRFMYIVYADAAGIVVGYHLGVALENQNASLQTDVDCGMEPGAAAVAIAGTDVDATWAQMDGTVIVSTPTANRCNDLTTGFMKFTNWSPNTTGNPAATFADSLHDFGGAGTQEAANGICTASLDSCIYDIIPK